VFVLQTQSTSETIRIGKRIGELLHRGDVVALLGELGAGKTQLIKGLAKGAGVKNSKYITSPSFTLINEYSGKIPFYHIDLFRLNGEREAEGLGLEEYLHGQGITAIEWADRILPLLPEETLRIHIHYTGKHSRSIEIVGKGERFQELMNRFRIADFSIS